MKNKRAALAAVVALLVAIAAWWQLGRGRGGSTPAAGSAAAATSAQVSRDRLLDPRAQGPVDVRTQPRGSIAGAIRRADGVPAAGARVCTWVRSPELSGEETREPICAGADDAGAYRLEDLVPGSYAVSATAPTLLPGYYETEDDTDRVVLAAGEHRTGIDIVLESGAVEVHGVVKDIGGGPVAGAWVGAGVSGRWSAGSGFARSGPDGTFALWTAPGQISVTAAADGYADGRVDAVAPGEHIEVFLTPESVLAGRVVEAGSDRPVPRAMVYVRGDWSSGNSSHGSAFTDERGEFRITRLAPGRYKPTAEAMGLLGQSAESVLLGLGATRDDIVIEVHPAYVLTGTIVIDGDDPTPCTRGHVTLHDKANDVRKWGAPEPDGTVQIRALMPGTYEVEVDCDGYLSRHEYPDVVIAGEDVLGVEWHVGAGAKIVGTVKSSAGEPVAWAMVSSRLSGGDPRGQRTGAWEQTERDGTYEMTGLVGGTYHVQVDASDQPEPKDPLEVEVADGATATLDIVLDAGGVIDGRVVDERGNPVGGANVRVVPEERWGGWRDSTRTADDGAFRLEGIRPGTVRVVASAGHNWWGGEALRTPGTSDDDTQGKKVTVEAGATASVELVVESQSGVIRGRVVDETGKPVSDAFVEKQRETDRAGAAAGGARREMRWGWSRQPVLTDVDGQFELDELSPGTYTVRAYRRGGGEAVAEGVAVGGEVVLTIASTGSMSGVVTTEGGEAPTQFTVTVVDRKQGVYRSEDFLMTKGAWALRDLPSGDFTVSATAGAGTTKLELALGEGEDRTGVDLVLESRATVTGVVVAEDTGKPLSGFRVWVRPVKGSGGTYAFGEGDKEHITDASGRFTVERAPAGRVYVTAMPQDWEETEYTWINEVHSLVAGKSTDVGKLEALRRRLPPRERAGDLGFTIAEGDPDDEPEDMSLEVALVRPDGPAANTGLAAGDVIVAVDGHDVTGKNAFRYGALTRVAEGTTITLGIKGGQAIEITAGKPL